MSIIWEKCVVLNLSTQFKRSIEIIYTTTRESKSNNLFTISFQQQTNNIASSFFTVHIKQLLNLKMIITQ